MTTVREPGRTDDVRYAEMAILGTILTSRPVAELVLERLTADDCFNEAVHQSVFAAVRFVVEAGEPLGLPAVLARLIAVEHGVWHTGEAGPLLTELTRHASAGWSRHVEVVRRAAVQRRLRGALETASAAAASPAFDPGEHGELVRMVVDAALASGKAAPPVTVGGLFDGMVDRLQSPDPPGLIRFPWEALRELVPWLRPGQLIVIAARPGLGKSVGGQDLARAVGIGQRVPVALFSMEMDRDQVMDRLLAAEARVPLERIKEKTLTEQDWDRVLRARERFADAPLVVDDTPRVSLAHARARLRGMDRASPPGLAIFDYLQLMDAPKAENRQQEVAALVGGLKEIARERRIPVVVLAQLNRGVETRSDRRPYVSDARESGCMPASARLLRADNGEEITLGELVLSQVQPMVVAVNSHQRLAPSRLTRAFPSGIKPVYRLRLASGRTVEATANHRFLTVDGWARLDALVAGSFIAVPRLLGEPQAPRRMDGDELILMAHLLGDGSIGPGFRYSTADPANKAAVEGAALRLFGIEARADRQRGVWQLWFPAPYRLTHGRRHPMSNWLEPYGLLGSRSGTKFIPEPVFGLPDDQLALFLRHLWATDGSITMRRNGRGPHMSVYYATISRRLAENVQRALLRFGVRSRVRPSRKTGFPDCWQVAVRGAPDQARFLTRVGCYGARGDLIPEALEIIAGITPNPNVDLVPWQVIGKVREALTRAGMSHRELAAALGETYCGSYLLGSEARPRRFSRARLARMAEVTGSAGLRDIAGSDLFWDEVAEVTPLGLMPTFDATVEGAHNFVANGVIAHNSIEQDADVAILIHRPEHYDADKRPGEADLIVDKNRDGRRGVATVGFQGEFVRFADLAWSPAPPPEPGRGRGWRSQADVMAQVEDRQQARLDELAQRRRDRDRPPF